MSAPTHGPDCICAEVRAEAFRIGDSLLVFICNLHRARLTQRVTPPRTEVVL